MLGALFLLYLRSLWDIWRKPSLKHESDEDLWRRNRNRGGVDKGTSSENLSDTADLRRTQVVKYMVVSKRSLLSIVSGTFCYESTSE